MKAPGILPVLPQKPFMQKAPIIPSQHCRVPLAAGILILTVCITNTLCCDSAMKPLVLRVHTPAGDHRTAPEQQELYPGFANSVLTNPSLRWVTPSPSFSSSQPGYSLRSLVSLGQNCSTPKRHHEKTYIGVNLKETPRQEKGALIWAMLHPTKNTNI